MEGKPVVGVVMGSESDLECMTRCLKQLEALEIPYEVRIMSAHRTPDTADEYAVTAADRGLKVIIAAAGMSAVLSGVLAARTSLPVVGVPMVSGALAGMDAALSTMQMPPGIPVACMAVGPPGATNAAVYAARILALGDPALAERLVALREQQAAKVARSDAAVRKAHGA